jgi:flagellar biosynthesis/type III secretory pathway M-ring protein FliF/YscJ
MSLLHGLWFCAGYEKGHESGQVMVCKEREKKRVFVFLSHLIVFFILFFLLVVVVFRLSRPLIAHAHQTNKAKTHKRSSPQEQGKVGKDRGN